MPGALIGVDVVELLERGVEMMHACDPCVPVEGNPGAALGAVIGQLASTGRNKLTLALTPRSASFGYWIEQLLAESTGKQGKGIVPSEGEPLGETTSTGTTACSFMFAFRTTHPIRGCALSRMRANRC